MKSPWPWGQMSQVTASDPHLKAVRWESAFATWVAILIMYSACAPAPVGRISNWETSETTGNGIENPTRGGGTCAFLTLVCCIFLICSSTQRPRELDQQLLWIPTLQIWNCLTQVPPNSSSLLFFQPISLEELHSCGGKVLVDSWHPTLHCSWCLSQGYNHP